MGSMNEARTELDSLGEFGLIKRISEQVQVKNQSTVKGIGDDAAVIKGSGKDSFLISTDMLVEGIHFDLRYFPLKHLGYKAVVSGISDIYAMNAIPGQVLVSVALSNRFSIEAIDEFYHGVNLACDKYQVDLIGGDTTSSRAGFIVSVTAIGTNPDKHTVYRNAAKKNDLICVSGDLGGAFVGLQLLEREKEVFLEDPNMQPELDGNDYILERQLKPEARKDIIEMLRELKIQPTAMMDISDGLSSEVLHICDQSDVGCVIYEEKLPIDPTTYNKALEFNLDPTLCALSGGEDYELLFAMDLNEHKKVENSVDITVVGHITDKSEGCMMVSKSNTIHELKAQGWDAFLDKKKQ